MTLTKEQIKELINDQGNTLFGIPFSGIQRIICEYQTRGVDPLQMVLLWHRVSKLEATIKELLKGGEHDGLCTNEIGEFGTEIGQGPCWTHVAIAEKREAEARKVLEEYQ